MTFVRARTKEQITSRQEEIINACDELLSRFGYEGVTFKAISELTSFTRPSIYNYYKTKDEVLLDLIKRELIDWQKCLVEMMEITPTMTKEEYSRSLTQQLESHDKLLMLSSILAIFIEVNSSVSFEKQEDFEKELNKLRSTFAASVNQYFPTAVAEKKEIFQFTFFAYTFGLFPVLHPSQKRMKVIEQTKTGLHVPDFQYICYHGILLLLSDL
ncbi:regulatory protein TetR [Clostridium sp. DL-VIII]|uniref:TetR/AcrR family transcriptional regulator n=1 Tax=Clostridium sp. DL-VIII TaxID=641107 RepID=UPI00023AFBB6|nr:TetR/AcrR family transcriptional regulator [Clostridium sp. DL-VIII]EHI99480.1 regulatory protein TetR [Clostridium sp. DL-VIII]